MPTRPSAPLEIAAHECHLCPQERIDKWPTLKRHDPVPANPQPAAGIAARAMAAPERQSLSGRPQSRAARGGGDAGRPGSGAGRRRHRQNPRSDDENRPHPQHGPGASEPDPRGHLHQQGGARDEGARRPHGRPGGRGHAVDGHLPRHRREDAAPPRRAGRAEERLHHPGRRRPDPADETAVGGRAPRREAMAGADAGR